jgi:hypothetical protein
MTTDKRRRESDGRLRGRYQRMRRQFLANAAAQGGASCWFCGGELDFGAKHPDPRAVEINHVIPVVVDPSKEFDQNNWKPCHRRCNSIGAAAFGPDDDYDPSIPDTGIPSEQCRCAGPRCMCLGGGYGNPRVTIL